MTLDEQIEVSDKPKAKKIVKYLCYETSQELRWFTENVWLNSIKSCKRRPAFDKECEVEDD